jgi:hypothetical protein
LKEAGGVADAVSGYGIWMSGPGRDGVFS